MACGDVFLCVCSGPTVSVVLQMVLEYNSSPKSLKSVLGTAMHASIIHVYILYIYPIFLSQGSVTCGCIVVCVIALFCSFSFYMLCGALFM